MLTIAIETSNPNVATAGVAVGEGARVLAFEALRPVARHEDDLTPALERALRAAGVRPDQIGLVAVSIGPGGYTSLRMACATAQMIALAAGCPCAPVPSAAVALRSVREEIPPFLRAAPVAVALAGKHDAAFITTFLGFDDVEVDRPGRLTAAGEAAELRAGTLVAGEHVPVGLIEAARAGGVHLLPLRLQAGALLELAPHARRVAPEACVPLYGREPEAVTKWRALHGSPGSGAG